MAFYSFMKEAWLIICDNMDVPGDIRLACGLGSVGKKVVKKHEIV